MYNNIILLNITTIIIKLRYEILLVLTEITLILF